MLGLWRLGVNISLWRPTCTSMSSSFAGGAAGQGGPSAVFAGSSWILMPSKASFFMVRNVYPVRLASDRITGLSHLSETKNPGPSSLGFRKKALVTLSPVKNFASTGAERCSGWKRCLQGALWTFTRKISCPHFATDQESFFPVVFGWRYFSSNQGPCRGISSSPVPPDFFWAFSASVLAGGNFGKVPMYGSCVRRPLSSPIADAHNSISGGAFRFGTAAAGVGAAAAEAYSGSCGSAGGFGLDIFGAMAASLTELQLGQPVGQCP